MTTPTNHPSEIAILKTALSWLEQDQRVALVTVAATWGSSPRPVGSLLAMSAAGKLVGSVSGGCVEDELLRRFLADELGDPPTLIDFGVDKESAARFGLPCGGRLELVVEELAGGGPPRALLARIQAGELVERRVCLRTGEASLHPATADASPRFVDQTLFQVFGPGWRLLLIGANDVAHYTAAIALTLGYRVTVCDPRTEYTAAWRVDQVELTHEMPDEAVTRLVIDARTAVVTLAHDPRLDDMALWQALRSPAGYVGALGSRRTSTARRGRLAELGLNAEQIDRLHAPVGLDIGSQTPAEIAVAIMAEIVAER